MAIFYPPRVVPPYLCIDFENGSCNAFALLCCAIPMLNSRALTSSWTSNRQLPSEYTFQVYHVNMEIDDMWMINFVPNGHKMDESLKVKYPLQSYPNVNVAHIFHNSLCNEFTINYLDIDSENEKQTVIKSA